MFHLCTYNFLILWKTLFHLCICIIFHPSEKPCFTFLSSCSHLLEKPWIYIIFRHSDKLCFIILLTSVFDLHECYPDALVKVFNYTFHHFMSLLQTPSLHQLPFVEFACRQTIPLGLLITAALVGFITSRNSSFLSACPQ